MAQNPASPGTLFTTVSDRLASFFPDDDNIPIDERKAFKDVEIQHISSLLQRSQTSWNKVPRTYIILRTIRRLDLLNDLIELGFTDHWFPVETRSLPSSLSPSIRAQFVKAQRLILTKSVDLEKGENGEHRSFARGEPLPFKIEAKLGSGGFSQVDRVLSLISYKEYALKRIRRRTIFGHKSVEDMKRFREEVQIIKRLKHWHIVEFVGSYTDPSYLGLLMSPVADMDVAKFLDDLSAKTSAHRSSDEKLSDLRTYFGCLASALCYLHDQSIRHKDIKPQNILIENKNVLFTDFGLSLDFSDASGSTTSGATAKTPRYCAPEVAAGNSRNSSSDIWSLGCVFFEMVAVLKGMTIAYMRDYFEENGSREPYYHCNIEATLQLLDQFESIGPLADSKPISWIREMLNRDRDARPTAAQLVTSIITPDYHDSLPSTFCGICCLGDDDTNSYKSVDEALTTASSSGPRTDDASTHLNFGSPRHEQNDVVEAEPKLLQRSESQEDILGPSQDFETMFLEILLADQRQHVQSVHHWETLRRWANASRGGRGEHNRSQSPSPAYVESGNKLRSDLQACINGFSGLNHPGPASSDIKDAIMREMKDLIQKHLPSATNDDSEIDSDGKTDDDGESIIPLSSKISPMLSQQDKSSILARNLRALDPDEAEELLVMMYVDVGETLRRLSFQIKVLLDIICVVGSPPVSGSGLWSLPKGPNIASTDEYLKGPDSDRLNFKHQRQEVLMQVLDVSSWLGQAVDVAQTQIIDVLELRYEQAIHLRLQRFLRYCTLNQLFADECEAISSRPGAELRSTVNSQIADFVSLMGELEEQRLAQTMDSDRWEAKDFGDSEDILLSRILDGMTTNPAYWLSSAVIWKDSEANTTYSTGGTAPIQPNFTGKAKTRSAVIGEEEYILAKSAMVVLQGIDRFENLIAAIPSLTSRVSDILLKYLKLFNSRLCQLILGAGATRSAGLKHITTKHLSLGSQALRFVITLIPYIGEFVRRHSSVSSPSLAEFNTLERLYQNSQASMYDKITVIMNGRAMRHVHDMKKIDWDSKAVDKSVSPHIETLTKETRTLHKVLSKYLPEASVRMVMGLVFADFREQWGRAFEDARVKTEAGKARLLRDAKLFDSALSKIDGSGDIGTYITNIVKEKEVETPAPAPPEAETNG